MLEIFVVLFFRILNSLAVATYFDPDEHYQSHEIAYLSVHGSGYKSWEWRVGLRSFLHPALLAIFYSLATPFYAQLSIKVYHFTAI
jgi:phosphatidylinositol glycan class B